MTKGTHNMRQQIYERLQFDMLDMSFDKYGCRVIQKILEFAVNKPKIQQTFLAQIKPKILSLIFDQFGNHVIQKTIDQINMEDTAFIIGVVENNVISKCQFQIERIVQ